MMNTDSYIKFMDIAFYPLTSAHFPLLLKWLEKPHVKEYWDKNISWTLELVREKYENHVAGYKILKLKDQIIKKPIHAFITHLDETPIGYIQYYNRHDFPSEHGYDLSELPQSCGTFDWYIAEEECIGKGIGTKILSLFIQKYFTNQFEYIFADPGVKNIPAIMCYKKLGFTTLKEVNNVLWMIKKLSS
ncbi:hypothetical protein phytr_10130 [Candidatus Phycorickettsia trachydisci]|uniref:N-acetyltransferase domain-containing protein n=1 Tax=Candidatus Phycorickettsia trachydisci TaxID=2115978 RepID=A0A2P1P9J4_9RICK|nr:GNAT family N-acetyltransferase [Candidatus Phycorickettsia trachydisci]AVP87941.1 hypothetical protein phytr_10130 [Candidatus Phycorickettsia trachydisci]